MLAAALFSGKVYPSFVSGRFRGFPKMVSSAGAAGRRLLCRAARALRRLRRKLPPGAPLPNMLRDIGHAS